MIVLTFYERVYKKYDCRGFNGMSNGYDSTMQKFERI